MGKGWNAFRAKRGENNSGVGHAGRLVCRSQGRGGRGKYASLHGALYANDMLRPRGKALQLEKPYLLNDVPKRRKSPNCGNTRFTSFFMHKHLETFLAPSREPEHVQSVLGPKSSCRLRIHRQVSTRMTNAMAPIGIRVYQSYKPT